MLAGKIGPGGMLPYGASIYARDIENYNGAEPDLWLTRLVRAIIQAAISSKGLHDLVPQVTDRIRTPDGGVDASLIVQLTLPEKGIAGIINPGKTIYQVKWRSKRENIVTAAKGELKKLRDAEGMPNYYVFVTNIDLSNKMKSSITRELRDSCEEFPANHIVILGAAELSDRINDDPRIRVPFFQIGLGACTLDFAREYSKRRFSVEPPIYNRKDEITEIEKFLCDVESRVINVYGPQAVGKTRIVIEALSSIPERVVWISETPIQATGLIQILDESPHPAVLVVDNAELESDSLLRSAIEAANLKTIIISTWNVGSRGVINLPVRPLSSSGSNDFLRSFFKDMEYPTFYWLYDQFGGLPGLLIQGAKALQSGKHFDEIEEIYFNPIMQNYEKQMTTGLGDIDALNALSLFPQSSLSRGSSDLEIICFYLGINISGVFKNLQLLESRGLIERIYSDSYRVTPPLLARRIAKRLLPSLAGKLKEIYLKLSFEGRAAIIRRLSEFKNDPLLNNFLSWLFHESGLFENVESISSNSKIIYSLAEGITPATSRLLRVTIEKSSVQELQNGLTGDSRREIVRALEIFIHGQDSFENGARSLLCLAEAENESWSNNATGIFKEMFNWRMPFIPKDGRLRVNILSDLASTESSKRKMIIIEAAAYCLKSHLNISVWQGNGVQPPEPDWRPKTRGEVHEAVLKVIELLKRLIEDSDHEIRTEAFRALCRGAVCVQNVGLWKEAISIVDFLYALPFEHSIRIDLIEGVSFLLDSLKVDKSKVDDDELRTSFQKGIKKLENIFTNLISSDFKSRFLNWVGPKPINPKTGKKYFIETSQIAEQGKKLATEVMSNPSIFEVELQDWLIDNISNNSGYFLFSLGEHDCDRLWLKFFEEIIERPSGTYALGIYLAGWLSARPIEAEKYLDSLAIKGGKASEASIYAILQGESSNMAVKRLLFSIKTGGIKCSYSLSILLLSWLKSLSIDDLIYLIKGLRDGTPETDFELLRILYYRWHEKKGEWNHVGPLAKEILLNSTLKSSTSQEVYYWDELASALAEWNLDDGLDLLFSHLKKIERGSYVFFEHHREQLIKILSQKDRPRLSKTFLEKALSDWHVSEELSYLINPKEDAAIILKFLEDHGKEAARLIAKNLNADKPGFWDMLPDLISKWGDDQKFRDKIIHSITWIWGVYSDRKSTLRPRLEPLEKLLEHKNPLVKEIARQAKEILIRETREYEPR